jgi:CheY-like chemotaxis protein/ketosteroid isomerase-like protein
MGNGDELVRASHVPVLVVEDDEDLGAALEELLSDAGFAVRLVRNVPDAERLLQTTAFSLVLTDYLLGSAEYARSQASVLLEAASDLPVGCLTAWDAIPPEVRTRFVFTLLKPFPPEELLAEVGKLAAVQVPDVARASVIARYFEALGAHDWAGLSTLCSERVRYHLPGTDVLSRTIEGRDAFRAHAAEVFKSFPAARFDVKRISWLPRGAVASYDGRWSTPDGRIGAASGAVYFQFNGTEISAIGVRTDLGQVRSRGSDAGPRGR